MAAYQLGGNFQDYNDPHGNPLISLRRDGFAEVKGIHFPDGTNQTTAGGSSDAVVKNPTADQAIVSGAYKFRYTYQGGYPADRPDLSWLLSLNTAYVVAANFEDTDDFMNAFAALGYGNHAFGMLGQSAYVPHDAALVAAPDSIGGYFEADVWDELGHNFAGGNAIAVETYAGGAQGMAWVIGLHCGGNYTDGASKANESAGVLIDDQTSGGLVSYGIYIRSQQNQFGFLSEAGRFVVDGTPVPATASSTGRKGEVAFSTTHVYVCTATDTWKRSAIATW